MRFFTALLYLVFCAVGLDASYFSYNDGITKKQLRLEQDSNVYNYDGGKQTIFRKSKYRCANGKISMSTGDKPAGRIDLTRPRRSISESVQTFLKNVRTKLRNFENSEFYRKINGIQYTSWMTPIDDSKEDEARKLEENERERQWKKREEKRLKAESQNPVLQRYTNMKF